MDGWLEPDLNLTFETVLGIDIETYLTDGRADPHLHRGSCCY